MFNILFTFDTKLKISEGEENILGSTLHNLLCMKNETFIDCAEVVLVLILNSSGSGGTSAVSCSPTPLLTFTNFTDK